MFKTVSFLNSPRILQSGFTYISLPPSLYTGERIYVGPNLENPLTKFCRNVVVEVVHWLDLTKSFSAEPSFVESNGNILKRQKSRMVEWAQTNVRHTTVTQGEDWFCDVSICKNKNLETILCEHDENSKECTLFSSEFTYIRCHNKIWKKD